MASSQQTVTTDHDEIRRWAQQHDGPAGAGAGTGDGEDPGILRIDFPGAAGEDDLELVNR